MFFGIFGPVATPPAKNFQLLVDGGLTAFIGRIIQLVLVIGGLYVLFQVMLAGYNYISANGDPKSISMAWARIWQAFLGIIIMAAAILLTSIVSWFVFGTPEFILNPNIPTP